MITVTPEAASKLLADGEGWCTVDEVPTVLVESTTPTADMAVPIVGQRVEVVVPEVTACGHDVCLDRGSAVCTLATFAPVEHRTVATALVAEAITVGMGTPGRKFGESFIDRTAADGLRLFFDASARSSDITDWLPLADWTPGRWALRLTEVVES